MGERVFEAAAAMQADGGAGCGEQLFVTITTAGLAVLGDSVNKGPACYGRKTELSRGGGEVDHGLPSSEPYAPKKLSPQQSICAICL
jgi:hypothetical protein